MVIIATNTRLDDMDRREDVNSEVFDIVERRIQFVNIFPMKKFTNKSSQRNTIKQEVTIAKIWALMEVMNCIYQKGIPPSKWSPDELVNVDLDSNVLSKTALKHI